MKKHLVLFTISLLLWSCTEEVSKDIVTDLTQESSQFFKFSEAISESNFLANLTFTEYLSISSAELPGCPTIGKTPNSRIIELNYSTPDSCSQANKTQRTGKIILDFTLSNSITPEWTLSYDFYSFNGSQIDGLRRFEKISTTDNREVFENLRVEMQNQVSFVASGALTYTVSRTSSAPIALSTKGKIEGRNPAGRNFSILITQPKEQLFLCYRQGWELPQRGKESWIVARSSPTSLDYVVNFLSGENCDPVITSTLPDGRTLHLNP